jgi:hypothetical protein
MIVQSIRESSRSIGDGAVPNVQPLRSDQTVRLDSSWFNVQWFKRYRSQPFNGSIVQQFKGRSHGWNFTFEDSRSVEGQDRLEVQLATSSLPDVDP